MVGKDIAGSVDVDRCCGGDSNAVAKPTEMYSDVPVGASGFLDSPGSGLGGGSLGLLLGVCTLQILMKPAMSMMRAMPISRTAHQWACSREGGQDLTR